MSEKKKNLALVLAAVMVFMTSVTSFAAESILSEAENDIQAEVAEEISANDAVPLSAEEEGGVVFGPAAGSDPSCLSVNGKDKHSNSHGHCIACESWEEIIQNINSGHADRYRECMEESDTGGDMHE